MLLMRSRLGETLARACIATILILSAYDLLLLASALRPLVQNPTIFDWANFNAQMAQSGYSLVCDVVGGFLGGAICWSVLKRLSANFSGEDVSKRRRATWNIMVSAFFVLAAGLAGC